MLAGHQIRTFLVGMPLALSLALSPTDLARGWDINALRAEESQLAAANGGKPRLVGQSPMAAAPTGWTNGQAVQQAYVPAGVATDVVHQTAHSGPSRGGTLFGGGNAGSPGATPGDAPRAEQHGATWNGYKLRMPTKWFSRGAPPKPSKFSKHKLPREAAAQAAAANRQSPYGATGAPPINAQHGMPMGDRRMAGHPQQLPAAVTQPLTGMHKFAAHGATHAGPPPHAGVAARQTTSPPVARQPSAPQATPQPGTPAAFSKPAEAVPINSQVAANQVPVMEAKTPADHLILQAHELSENADREDDYTRIIETCRRARVSQPSAPLGDYAKQLTGWALNRRGQLKADSGRIKEAMLDFDDAIRANPNLWRALHNRGVLQAQAGKFEQAFDDFNRTVQLNPEFAKAYSNRAALFVVAGDLPAALEDYGRAIELDPNLAVAHRGRGRVCHLLGRLDDGISHYDAAVQLASNDAYATACRADLLTDLGRYVDAAAGYNRAIQLDPQSLGAFRGSAWLLATCPDKSVRDADLAIERAKRAIELDANGDAVNLDTLAAAQASAGDFTMAMQTLRRAIEKAPADDRDVYEDRLLMYQRAKPYRIAPMREVTPVNYEQ